MSEDEWRERKGGGERTDGYIGREGTYGESEETSVCRESDL